MPDARAPRNPRSSRIAATEGPRRSGRQTQSGPSGWRELAEAALSGSGAREGGARRAVIEAVSQQECLTSAQELADRLREGGSSVGLASVYRALDLLHGLGLLQRVEFGDGTARYEPVLPGGHHHHHAVCDRCGRIQTFEDPDLEERIERLSKRLGHRPTGHDLILHGTCASCRESE